jgi:hypothetical protein
MLEKKKVRKEWTGSQITGTASSYARKYALNGLFCIDDTKDADTDEFVKQTQEDDKKIDKAKLDALNKSIENNNIDDSVVEIILSQYGYTSTKEIKMKDYMKIVSDLKSKVKEE